MHQIHKGKRKGMCQAAQVQVPEWEEVAGWEENITTQKSQAKKVTR